MRLASLKSNDRDGTLVVVDSTLSRAVAVPQIAGTLQQALDNWSDCAPQLEAIGDALEAGRAEQTFALNHVRLASPLPRCYQFLDGSVYLSHMEKARRARGAAMPSNYATEPLMYQGLSDHFLAPADDVPMTDEALEIDLEAEVGVIVDDVPLGTTAEAAGTHIKLLVLINDWSLRGLTRVEVPRGFGFVQSKPASALSPVAVTPDALGPAWDGRKLSLPLHSSINGEHFGQPQAGEDMYFDYCELIAHAARTRALRAGTLIGAGTVSNRDAAAGYGCIAEARTDELLADGEARTPFLKFGDVVRIEMFDAAGETIFGAIEQRIVAV
jgi:fumarylacetoacetate (FAA) hydrolase